MVRASEEPLRESQKTLEAFLNATTDVAFLIDTSGTILAHNQAAAKFLRKGKKQALGRRIADFMTPEMAERSKECAIKVIQTGQPVHYEIDYQGMCVENRIYPIFDDGGRVIKLAVYGRNITERKRAEEQLKQSREQLRALSAKMEMIREEERARIAREIHDELGQGLTALKMDLVWLTNRLSQEPKMLRQRTRTMSKLIDSTILSVRRISSELRPGVLDDLGLTAAIEWGAREFQKRTGIHHQFSSNKEEFDLTKDCATAVFRIFQETLTNVTRHARATRINVSLEENAGSLLLEIRDDGRGITEKEISNPKSMGLLGMRERALLFGGEIKISGAPGKGTTVRLEIPLKKPMNGKKEGHRPGRMRRRG